MAGRRLRAVFAAVLAPCLLGAPAAADDPDASQPPRTSGPLVGLSLPCDEEQRFEGGGGATMSSCAWSYELLPAETNLTQDFAALWVQMQIDPGKECVQEIGFALKAPDEVRLVSAVPAKSSEVRSRAGATTRLVVDGDGAAPVPGVIEQDVAPGKGSVFAKLGEHEYRYLWRGNTRRRVMVAIGLQIADDTIPKSWAQAWSESLHFQWGACHPDAIWVDKTRDQR